MQDLEAGDPPTVGPYRLRARLGEGGMGRVFLAHSPSGRLVAVKVIRPELAGDGTFRDRFRREVAAARRVSGAFTAPVIDADPDGAHPWLATQYVPGPSLHEAVAQAGPFAEGVLRRLGAGVLEAIIAVHQAGVVHRDLKPSNVLLAADGPRLIDFGIARATDHTELTRSGDIVGTASYMSPEQALGEEAGPAADVFAAAAVLVFAATGRGPFGAGGPAAVLYRIVHGAPDLTGVPAALSDTLHSCLAKDPAARPTPAALLGWLADGVQVAGPSWPEGVTRLVDRRAAEVDARLTPARPSAGPIHAHAPGRPQRTGPSAARSLPPTRVTTSSQTPPPTPTPSPPPAAPPIPSPTPTPDSLPAPAERARPLPATIFPGRWRLLLAVGLTLTTVGVVLLVVSVVGAASAAQELSRAASTSSSSSSVTNRLITYLFLAVVGFVAIRIGWWRVRHARPPALLSIAAHGMHVAAGREKYTFYWQHVARADVIRHGGHDVLAVWPVVPGTTWTTWRGSGRRRSGGRHRPLWHNPALGCDMVLDMRLLRGTPSREVSMALGEVHASHHGHQRPSRPRGPAGW